MLVAYLTSQICIVERTGLIYIIKQIPAEVFTNVRGLWCMWNFVDLYDTRLSIGLRLRVSDISAVESSQKP